MPAGNPTFTFDIPDGEERLRELVLYIATKCADDTAFGAIKLNKILWLSDFLAYARYGDPITGVEYQRLPNGPAPRRLLPVREAMIEAGDASEERRMLGGYVQKRLIPLRTPNLNDFTSEQVALVDEIIAHMWNISATATSKWSHGKPWQAATDVGTLIPYEAVFLSDEGITPDDEARTKELASEHAWGV